MIARNQKRLTGIESAISSARVFPVDGTDTPRFNEALDRIFADFGLLDVVIPNAVGGAFGNFMQIDPAIVDRNFQINVMAFLHLARRVAPTMIWATRDRQKGSISNRVADERGQGDRVRQRHASIATRVA
jgi:short-subunit dehydrogenase